MVIPTPTSLPSDIVFHPRAEKKDPRLPKRGLLFVNPGEARFAHQLLLQRGGKRAFLFNSSLTISGDETFFVAGPCIGAPQAVLILEKLIILGGASVIQMGWCGSLEVSCAIADILIPDGVVSGEGTSQYYVPQGEDAPGPSLSLVRTLVDSLRERGYRCGKGRLWSTDAFYRESRSELEILHQEKGVAGVDMEFSALCAVAAFRGIDFAGVMVVSDELFTQNWNPGFATAAFKKQCREMIHFLLENGGTLA